MSDTYSHSIDAGSDHPGHHTKVTVQKIPSASERKTSPGSAELTLTNSRSAYFVDGTPQLRDSFVVYLDALGTKEHIRALGMASLAEERDRLLDLDRILHKEEWEGDRQRFVTFTDNVVLGAPVDQRYSSARQLRFLLSSMAHYQLKMTELGRPLRGGVCLGPLFMDDRLVTGQGLVDAVLLEETEAIFPRVLLHRDCYQRVRADVSEDDLSAGRGMPWPDLLLADGDGELFLNYLAASERSQVPAEIEGRLTLHRQVIQDHLRKDDLPSAVRKKYTWMAEYHNFVQSTFFQHVAITVREAEIDRDCQRAFHLITNFPGAQASTTAPT